MEQRMSLITLGVGDLARARRFYKELGWQAGRVEEGEVAHNPGFPIDAEGNTRLR